MTPAHDWPYKAAPRGTIGPIGPSLLAEFSGAMLRLRKWFKTVKQLAQSQLVRWRYGTYAPESVRLPGSPHPLFVDPLDPRAYKILVIAPLFGRVPRNLPFWREGCTRLGPSLALDIGMNFGECLFSPDYPEAMELHGFEANPRLRPYIQKSAKAHPARRQMSLHYALVAAAPGADAEFFIDRRWSGGSTAVPGLHPEDADRYEAIRVPVTSIDERLAKTKSLRPGRTLFFKIDVEGYEFHVLRGMQNTLASPRWALGLVEFDTRLLERAGVDLQEYWQFLQERFEVFAFARKGQARRVRDWSDLAAMFRRPQLHTDLLLLRGEVDDALEQFLANWCEAPPERTAAARAA